MDKRDYINLLSKGAGIVINSLITFFLTKYIVNTVGAVAYGYIGLANEFLNYIQEYIFIAKHYVEFFSNDNYDENEEIENNGNINI